MFSTLLPSQVPLDVICFNEVTTVFEQEINRNVGPMHRLFAANDVYLVTPRPSLGSHHAHCPAILSFFPILEAHVIRLRPAGRPGVAALIQNTRNGESVVVVSVHLHSEETIERMKLRELQLESVMKQLLSEDDSRYSSQFIEVVKVQKRVIILGDFNYHLPVETKFIYDLGYIDVWRHLHGTTEEAEDRGVTWEGHKSPYLLFDNRRMRLDRAIVPQGALRFFPKEMTVFGTEPVPNVRTFWPNGLLHSDHYGIRVVMTAPPPPRSTSKDDDDEGVSDEVRLTSKYVPSAREKISPHWTGYRTIQQIKMIRLVAAVLGLVVFATVYLCL